MKVSGLGVKWASTFLLTTVMISQCSIANNFGLLTFTVHNIMKRFRESGEISVHKAKAGNYSWIWVIFRSSGRRLYTRHRYATMINIVTWAQEKLAKPFSINTVLCYIQKCNLKLLDKKADQLCPDPRQSAEQKLILDGQKDSWHMFCGQISPHFQKVLKLKHHFGLLVINYNS